ncbi:uncharacterized protein ALTATR162_LOCUS2920 [Alternaria atra]|jgi:hypothetical protein|uniref:Uncharacterized protein n=1 Tax=Alternaria atra TaxID=119953 RepID=A0A8J2HYR2_9PLEO|nr:uncharacterized protein ALTATR162_LOCUS2920 [Alternaria atra]CAG5152804.1 unnamed protein product [Alternaria atra]
MKDGKSKADDTSTAATKSEETLPSYNKEEEDGPPTYTSVARALTTLSEGPLDETIPVPMISRTVANSIHNYNPFSRKQGEVKQSIVIRQMKRSQYLAHYVKDAEGNFVGTGAPAPDAGLVFVPGKSSSEDLLKQANEVALGVQRRRGKGIGKFGMPQDDNSDAMMGAPAMGGA